LKVIVSGTFLKLNNTNNASYTNLYIHTSGIPTSIQATKKC